MQTLRATNLSRGERQPNLELLRIVAMFMVIAIHYFGHSGFLDQVRIFTPNYYFSSVFYAICYVSVNCYVLISGYFMIHSKFRLKRVVLIVFQTWTISVLLSIVLFLTGNVELSLVSVTRILFPISTGRYWFATMYVGLCLLAPFLNSAFKMMNKTRHLALIILLLLLFSIWTDVFFFTNGLNVGRGGGVVWLIVLYSIAAYIRLYEPFKEWSDKKTIAVSLVTLSLLPLSKLGIGLLTLTPMTLLISASDIQRMASDLFCQHNSILAVIASVTFFAFFLRIQIRSIIWTKVICFFAPLTFGVYLVHETPYLRGWVWGTLINPVAHMDAVYFPLFTVGALLAVFLVCAMLEWTRQKIFDGLLRGAFFSDTCDKIQAFAVEQMDRLSGAGDLRRWDQSGLKTKDTALGLQPKPAKG